MLKSVLFFINTFCYGHFAWLYRHGLISYSRAIELADKYYPTVQ